MPVLIVTLVTALWGAAGLAVLGDARATTRRSIDLALRPESDPVRADDETHAA